MEKNFKEVEINDPVIIICINRTYKENEESPSPECLYEITRAAWKVGIRRDRAEYALAVYRGIVKEVYIIYSWNPADKDSIRWLFNGEVAEDSIRNKYINRSVKQYRIWGCLNPILYVNC